MCESAFIVMSLSQSYSLLICNSLVATLKIAFKDLLNKIALDFSLWLCITHRLVIE